MVTEQQIKMAAKLYECRDTARKFFKGDFPERIKFYKEVIQAYQSKHGTEVIPSVTAICGFDAVKGEAMAVMMFMAAAVELIEPSKDA